jgi:bifunctional pyridoxal-dependent enzyme with beta-cystathionase and maltose regulon repressor activities
MSLNPSHGIFLHDYFILRRTCMIAINENFLKLKSSGAGFGKCGEGHVRLSAFNSLEKVEMGLDRIRTLLH